MERAGISNSRSIRPSEATSSISGSITVAVLRQCCNFVIFRLLVCSGSAMGSEQCIWKSGKQFEQVH